MKVFTMFIAPMLFLSTTAFAEPAEVLHDTSCVQFDSNGTPFISDSDMTVITNSENGNIMFKCKSSGVLNDTGKRQVFTINNTGYTCHGQENWKQVLTPSGEAITRCHAKF